MIRARLTAQAFIGGKLREPGEEFELAEGVRGPHRTHVRQHETLNVNEDQKRILPDHVDEPLYQVWDEASAKWVRPSGT